MSEGPGRVGLAELLAGVPFPTAALEIVRYAIGGPRCRSLVLGGDRHGPEAAAASGLVDDIAAPDDLLDRAVAGARHLAGIPADAYELSKRQLHRAAHAAITAGTEQFESEVERLWTSPRTRHTIAAYVEQVTGR